MNSRSPLVYAFEEKIQKEWEEKWASFGVYDSLKFNRRSKFYESLAAEISDQTGIKIGRDTIRRFDEGKGGNSKNSLEAISRYVGYDSLEEFEKSLSQPKRSKQLKSILLVISGLGLISLFIVGFYSFYWKAEQEKKELILLLEMANAQQFNAFQALDTTKLSLYYTHNGSAIKGIKTVINESLSARRTIKAPKDNPSFHKILNAKIVDLNDSTAKALTQEHWFLRWYDKLDKRFEVSYDEKNEQYYEFKKVNGVWKIHNNFFPGKATVIDY